MADLHLSNLEKVYGGGFKAVHGIDLTVADGEFMVLVGPSGCAKSTTLRMIAGLESVTSGEIRIGEKVINDLAPGKRGIAMVFQNYALYPHMKVQGNLSFGLRLQRVAKARIEALTRYVTELLEITPLLERLPKQLSGGQAQRVALGRALIKHPEVFLFDEPLSNLDAKLRAAMRVRITELHKGLKAEGRPATVIYVTHDQVEAMTMGDRICVMKEGRIMQVADPTTLYERPANAFVAGFIGMPEMNLLSAELGKKGKTPTLTLGSQTITIEEGLAPRIARDAGPVILGLRPQHLEVCAKDTANCLTGEIATVEFMGHEINLHVRIGTDTIVAVAPSEHFSRRPECGDIIALRPNGHRLHLFDPESEENISLITQD